MRPDPGQPALDRHVAAASIEERVAWNSQRRRLGIALLWQQLDASGIADPLEQADFLFRRLYPEMPESWFEAVLHGLHVKLESGQWHGFERPRPASG